MNVIIGIGFGNLTSDEPENFTEDVEKVVKRLGKIEATMEGRSWSPEWGHENGVWFAASFPDFDTYVEARARILAIGATYRQDAVAFTVGTVDVADCPTEVTRAREYRDLL